MNNANRYGWWPRAACQAADPDLFFPISRAGNDGQEECAKQVCGRCPVKTDCLAYALAAGPGLLGIWGGTSEADRAELRRAKRRADCAACPAA
jgi:WhiB family redox-sensing transcriptional regulator